MHQFLSQQLSRSNYTNLARSKSRGAKHAHPEPTPIAPGRKIPWIAIGLTLLIFITAAFAVDPVRDAATHEAVGEASLAIPASYLFLEPLSSTFDTITLLSVGQHIAVILWAIGIFVFVRVRLTRKRPTNLRREGVAAVLMLLGIFITYAAATMLPRPMAQLALSDPQVAVADFHSHTKYSHDGRAGWSDEDVRDWYHGAGFDMAYVTDHATFEGAERAFASNPGQAGENTMLLPGIEAFYKGEHVNVLSAGRRFRGLLDATQKDVDVEALTLASIVPATAPTLIETMPGNLNKLASITSTETQPGVSAIEIVDGSPRGLSQTRRDHDRIVHLADSLNLALVTGSDNHGWGYTAAGWTLLRINGWRGMPPDSISRGIEQILRVGRRGATRTVERRAAGGTNPISLLFAGPLVTWRMFTTLSADERVAWIIWVWVLVVATRAVKRWRVRPSTAA